VNLATYPPYVIPNHLDVCARSGQRGAHDSENPVRPGTDLCAPCHERFPRVVADLARYWVPLKQAHLRRPASKDRSRFSRNGGGGEVRDVGALWNPTAAIAISELESWTRALQRRILKDRRFYDHEILGFVDEHHDPVDVALAQVALHHARWLTEHPTVGPAVLADAIQLRALAMRALDQPGFRTIRIRDLDCKAVIWEAGYGEERCLAPMVGIIPADGAWQADTGPARIICSANPNHPEIPVDEWLLHA